MAQNVFRVETTGIKDVLDALDNFTDEMPRASKMALDEMEKVIEDKIRDNYVNAGGSVGDFIYDSIGRSVESSESGDAVFGTVGVYKIDHVALSHNRVIEGGDKPADVTAPTIAYWMEYGTSTLNAEAAKRYGRKAKLRRVDYPESELNFRSPRPFVSASFYATIEEQTKTYIDTLLKETGM